MAAMRCCSSSSTRGRIVLVLFVLTTFIHEALSWQSVGSSARIFSLRRILSAQLSSSWSSPEQEHEEIIMLSGYPFYVNGPDPKAIAKVEEKTRTLLEQVCGDQLKSVSRMGSSAIDGIAGTPVCDILAELSPWPMTKNAKTQLAKYGYEFKGTAPHDDQDEWFFGGDGKPGHLGRVVLHTVPEGSEFVRDMKAFVEYVNTHSDAFQRYNDVKVEGAVLMSRSSNEDGRLLGYKGKKAAVCNEIKREAIDWWARTNGGKGG